MGAARRRPAGRSLRGEDITSSSWQSQPVPALEGFQVQPRSLSLFRAEQMVNLGIKAQNAAMVGFNNAQTTCTSSGVACDQSAACGAAAQAIQGKPIQLKKDLVVFKKDIESVTTVGMYCNGATVLAGVMRSSP